MTFSERLRSLREERNTTQKTLAAMLGVSPRMVSFYESGAHFPRDEQILICLADYFGVTTDYLLGYSNVKKVQDQFKLNQVFETLQESDRKSLLDFLEFLSAKQKRPRI